MRELLPAIDSWREAGQRVALATVVKVYGSAPRGLGSKMVISSGGAMQGSVSGGCVEGNVFEEGQSALKDNRAKLLPYGISDELMAETVGLACGGNIEVFVEPLGWPQDPSLTDTFLAAVRQGQMVSLAIRLDGPAAGAKLLVWPDGRRQGSLGAAELDGQAALRAESAMRNQQAGRHLFEVDDQTCDVFVDVFVPPPRLIVVGAVHIAVPLITFANELGFRTIVVDARPVFASRKRFPHADEIIVGWPADVLASLSLDESSCVAVLSHDPKFDNPALVTALNSPARYVGALGSSRTHARRVESLLRMGVSREQIDRIHAPIGLKLRAQGPQEVAVSIIAQIVAQKRGATV